MPGGSCASHLDYTRPTILTFCRKEGAGSCLREEQSVWDVVCAPFTGNQALESRLHPSRWDKTSLQAATRPPAHYQASELEQLFLSSIPGPSGMMSCPPSGIRPSKGLQTRTLSKALSLAWQLASPVGVGSDQDTKHEPVTPASLGHQEVHPLAPREVRVGVRDH